MLFGWKIGEALRRTLAAADRNVDVSAKRRQGLQEEIDQSEELIRVLDDAIRKIDAREARNRNGKDH